MRNGVRGPGGGRGSPVPLGTQRGNGYGGLEVGSFKEEVGPQGLECTGSFNSKCSVCFRNKIATIVKTLETIPQHPTPTHLEQLRYTVPFLSLGYIFFNFNRGSITLHFGFFSVFMGYYLKFHL
jgi:hypothetical protein